MKLKDFSQSTRFKGALYGIGFTLIILLIFQAGIFIGYRKAAFSYRWGENHYQTFGGPRGREMMHFPQVRLVPEAGEP